MQSSAAFALHVVGGSGGSGKTRLAVELCGAATSLGWVAGLLLPAAEQAALEELAAVPAGRLVVVDYAEYRVEQLEALLRPLIEGAAADRPVRVLLLIRSSPLTSESLAAPLLGHSDWLDTVLDLAELSSLSDAPLDALSRSHLFEEAVDAFSSWSGKSEALVNRPKPTLDNEDFQAPLLVIIAAFLFVAGGVEVPERSAELLEEVIRHEDRYWQPGQYTLPLDQVVRRRAVALATLVTASTEAGGAELLLSLDDLADANIERRRVIARWLASLYPGPGWWNPLEPDLLAEHLVATTLADMREVLVMTLRLERDSVVRSLELFARAAANYEQLRAALAEVLSESLAGLAQRAVDEVQAQAVLKSALRMESTASALNRLLGIVKADESALSDALATMPQRPDLLLSPLALTLSTDYCDVLRDAARSDEALTSKVAWALNDLSIRYKDMGRLDPALDAIREAVEIRTRLVASGASEERSLLATALTNLSNQQAAKGLEVSSADLKVASLQSAEAAMAICQELYVVDDGYSVNYAGSLSNLSNRYAEFDRPEDSLFTLEAALAVFLGMPERVQSEQRHGLVGMLNNLAIRLSGDPTRAIEAAEAARDALRLCHALVQETVTSHQPLLAVVLMTLARVSPDDAEVLASLEEACRVRRALASFDPSTYEVALADSLTTLGERLERLDCIPEAKAALSEAADCFGRLAEADPSRFMPRMTAALTQWANVGVQRRLLTRPGTSAPRLLDLGAVVTGSPGGNNAGQASAARPTRNGRCPCGSGRKYKRCHGDPRNNNSAV
jgi:hypothetical protein